MAKRSQAQPSLFDTPEVTVAPVTPMVDLIREQILRDIMSVRYEESLKAPERSAFWIDLYRKRIVMYRNTLEELLATVET